MLDGLDASNMSTQEEDPDRGHRPNRSAYSRQRLQFQEPERRPLLGRLLSHPGGGPEPVFSCSVNAHSHLPVYTNIHRIRRDVISIVEDFMTLEQLRDLRINISVIRPLVDQLYELDDISIGMSSRMPSRPPPRKLMHILQCIAFLSTVSNFCTSSLI